MNDVVLKSMSKQDIDSDSDVKIISSGEYDACMADITPSVYDLEINDECFEIISNNKNNNSNIDDNIEIKLNITPSNKLSSSNVPINVQVSVQDVAMESHKVAGANRKNKQSSATTDGAVIYGYDRTNETNKKLKTKKQNEKPRRNRIEPSASNVSTNISASITIIPRKAASSTSTSSSSSSSDTDLSSSNTSTTEERVKKSKKKKAQKFKKVAETSSSTTNTQTYETEESIKIVVDCLKEFYVETDANACGSLIHTLRNYTLGAKDELKCILCCIESFDLSGFIANHLPPREVADIQAAQSTRDLITSNKQMFCNRETLEKISNYVSTFNPFCDDYCKKFYPNCSANRKELPNFNNNSSNKNRQALQQQLQNTNVIFPSKQFNSISMKCKPTYPQPQIPPLPSFSRPNNFNNNAEFNASVYTGFSQNSILNYHLQNNNVKNMTSNSTVNTMILKEDNNDKQNDGLLKDTNKTISNKKFESLVDCLKDFNFASAKQNYEANKKTILNFGNLVKQTPPMNPTSIPKSNLNSIIAAAATTTKTATATATTTTTTTAQASIMKMKCISNELLKYKPMPVCRDSNGNLILNIDVTKSCSRRAHNLTNNLLSNRNLKIQNLK